VPAVGGSWDNSGEIATTARGRKRRPSVSRSAVLDEVADETARLS